MEYALAILILAALVVFVAAPLRRGGAEAGTATEDPVVAELEARKEAKYREIRDAEMDRAQGKLTEDDFRRQDAELRAEAIAILKELDRVQGKRGRRAKGEP
jgi:flagellar biosynthesis/type III secretory pathway M-ring protein FliF/YscJ